MFLDRRNGTSPGALQRNPNETHSFVTEIGLCVAFLLMFLPLLSYAVFYLRRRRIELIGQLSVEAKRRYLNLFHHRTVDTDVDATFNNLDDELFGSWKFIVPIALLTVIVWLGLAWTYMWIANPADKPVIGPGEATGVAAFSGAFCTSWASNSIRLESGPTSNDVYWGCFRLIFALPFGFAAAAAFGLKGTNAAALAFFTGTFPTTTLQILGRRIAGKWFNLQELPKGGDSELRQLQGIDTRQAERFATERNYHNSAACLRRSDPPYDQDELLL